MSEGTKHDSGKPKMSLVTYEFVAGTAKALEYGMNKYGKNNYKKGMAWSRVIDALMRHTLAFAHGEEFDQESGLPHIYHMAACLNMLTYYYDKKLGEDDRA